MPNKYQLAFLATFFTVFFALVAAFHRDQPRHGHGAHRYTAADFGLDEGALRERFAFLADGPGAAP